MNERIFFNEIRGDTIYNLKKPKTSKSDMLFIFLIILIIIHIFAFGFWIYKLVFTDKNKRNQNTKNPNSLSYDNLLQLDLNTMKLKNKFFKIPGIGKPKYQV